MRRTKTKTRKHTLRGLRVETLERRNLLAFGGLRMFLSYSDNAEPTNLATETKTTAPAIVAKPAPIQTPVVVQSFAPVSSPAKLAPPASVPAEIESTTVMAIQTPAVASQLIVLAETTMPNAVSALDPLVIEAADSSVSTGASLRSLITTPSDAAVVALLNDDPANELLSSLSDSVEVENLAEAIPSDSIATQSNASIDNMGEPDPFVDTFVLPSVSFAYSAQTRAQLNSGLEETSLAELDNRIGGNDRSLESSNGSDDNRIGQVKGINIDDTNGGEVSDSFIDDGSLSDLDSGFDDNSGVLDGDSDHDDFGISNSVDAILNNIDNSILDLSGDYNFESNLNVEFVSDLDNSLSDSNSVVDSGNDTNATFDSNGGDLSDNDQSCSAFDNEVFDSSGVHEVDADSGRLVSVAGGSTSATANYGTWSASLVGSGTGSVVYQREGYESEFSARVFGTTPNATLDVVVGGVLVGQIRTNGTGSGRLKLENDDGRSLPIGFPVIGPTVHVSVGSSISGVFGQRSNGSHD